MKYHIERINKAVVFYLIEPNEVREFIFESSNGMVVSSINQPELTSNEIFLAGTFTYRDAKVSVKEFESEYEADLYIERVEKAIAEWEFSLKETNNGENKELQDGDKVYFPFLGNRVYTITKSNCLKAKYPITINGCLEYYSFTVEGKQFRSDRIPSIFLATPKNKKLLSKLYKKDFESIK